MAFPNFSPNLAVGAEELGWKITQVFNGPAAVYAAERVTTTGGGADVDSDVHIQTVASTTWIHAHGLGRNVSISVFDGLDPTAPGSPVTGQVSFVDLNTVQIEFGSARTGHSVAT